MADIYSEDRLRKIFQEVLQLRSSRALTALKKRWTSHTKTLDFHSQILDSHTKTLDSHTRILDSHTRTLDSHTRTLDSHTERWTPTPNFIYTLSRFRGQSIRLNSIQTDLSQIKEALEAMAFVLEDLEGRFTTLCEAVMKI